MAELPIWMVLAVNRFLVCSLHRHFQKDLLKYLQEIPGKEHISTCYYIGFKKWAYSMKMLVINMSITHFLAIHLPRLLMRKYLLNGLLPRILCWRPFLPSIQKSPYEV